jgi:hypothetical protein
MTRAPDPEDMVLDLPDPHPDPYQMSRIRNTGKKSDKKRNKVLQIQN